MVKLSAIFKVHHGIFLGETVEISSKYKDGYIPYIRPSKNQGNTVAGYVNPIEIIEKHGKEVDGKKTCDKIYEANNIFVGVDGEGSHTYSYISNERFVANSNVKVLIPYEEMDFFTKMYYTLCITSNRYRFSYGRKPKGDMLPDLLVPARAEIPAYIYRENLPDVSTIPDYFMDEGYDKACWYMDNINQQTFEEKYKPPVINEKYDITSKTKGRLKVSDIFKLHQGNGLSLANLDKADLGIPFISRTAENNGISDRVVPLNALQPFSTGLITVALGGSVLSTFIQHEPFYTGYHIMVLEPYTEISDYAKMFIITEIEANKFRYSYGRQANTSLGNLVLELPIEEDGSVDYEFMENYIKSLSFSKSILKQ